MATLVTLGHVVLLQVKHLARVIHCGTQLTQLPMFTARHYML